MNFSPLPLSGAYRIETEPFVDHRGKFARIFCTAEFSQTGLVDSIQQANISLTKTLGAVRGMHFQKPPHAETKIVRCLHGTVFDVVVDLRPDSSTFLKWHGEILDAKNMHALFIPPGFAHGFQCLTADCELLYLHTAAYTPGCEGAVRFDDPAIGIEWPLTPTDLSDRDKNHPLIDNTFQGIKL